MHSNTAHQLLRLARCRSPLLSHASASPLLRSHSTSISTAADSPLPPPSAPPKHPTASSSSSTSSSPLSPKSLPRPIPRAPISPYSLPADFGSNQLIHVPDEKRLMLERVMSTFKAPVRYGFAYGSGVFKQEGYDTKEMPMVDFILAVTHPDHWHSINLHQNPSHYPLYARLAGARAIERVQHGFGARVWYVSMVEIDGVPLKYGVISVDDLCRDLMDWETLYVSGRMHKPVRIIKDDARVRLAQQVNLTSALRTALLLLPDEFAEQELYERIAGLSYSGDPRMTVGENPDKVHNIVRAQVAQFHGLYAPLAVKFSDVQFRPGWRKISQGKRRITQPNTTRHRVALATKLPLHLREKLRHAYLPKLAPTLGGSPDAGVPLDEGLFWSKVVEDPAFSATLERAIAETVRGPAVVQSLKGIVSAGLGKSARYAGRKLGKWWEGRLKKEQAA